MAAHTGLHQDAWLAQMLPQQFHHSFFLACTPCPTLHGQTSLVVGLHTPLVVSHKIGGGVRDVGRVLHSGLTSWAHLWLWCFCLFQRGRTVVGMKAMSLTLHGRRLGVCRSGPLERYLHRDFIIVREVTSPGFSGQDKLLVCLFGSPLVYIFLSMVCVWGGVSSDSI